MATIREQLESFQKFANDRLEIGGVEPTMDERLMEWADRPDRHEINKAIHRGIADVDAGRYEPADVAMERIRQEFDLPAQ